MSRSLHKPRALADRKLRAIDLLVAGRPLIEVAKDVDISREQLWRWRQEPEFITRQEQVRAEAHMARADRLWSLIDKAQDVAEESLDEGDPQLAMDVLRLLARGFTDMTPITVTSSAKEPSPAAGPDRQLESWECSSCGKVAKTERGLGKHIRARHPGSA